MTVTLAMYLNLIGLGLDFAGAALLAYDALYGPHARLQASIRRDRLQRARDNQERRAQDLRELSQAVHAPDEQARLLREQVPALSGAADELLAEVRYWEQHELRVHHHAVRGLLLLVLGFAFQGLASVLTLTLPVVVPHPRGGDATTRQDASMNAARGPRLASNPRTPETGAT